MTLKHFHKELNFSNYKDFTDRIEIFLKTQFIESNIGSKSEDLIVPLPTYSNNLITSDFLTLLKERKTSRSFKKTTVEFEKLSFILQNSEFYPSAGGLNTLKIGIISNSIIGLDQGAYLYDINKSILYTKYIGDVKDYIETANLQHNILTNSAAIIFLISETTHTYRKYGDRAYRFINLEAGHLQQNLCLLSQSINLKTFICGGYFEAKYQHLFELEEDDLILSQIAIGY